VPLSVYGRMCVSSMYSNLTSVSNLYHIQSMSCSKLGKTKLRLILLASLKHGGATKWRVTIITGFNCCVAIARNCCKNAPINADKCVRLSCCLSTRNNPRTTEWIFVVGVAVLGDLLNWIQPNEFPLRSGSSSSVLHTELHFLLHTSCSYLASNFVKFRLKNIRGSFLSAQQIHCFLNS
jgi:hypothetical protein